MAKVKQTSAAVAGNFNTKWLYVIVAAFSALIYLNTTLNDYSLDDELVTRGQRLTSQGISAIPDIFKEPYYKDRSGYAYEYRPIVLVTFAIENSIFGEHPGISHFINVLLYALMCVVLLLYLSLLLKDFNILVPLLITILFAVHPIHTEVVASIKNRDEILALLFALLASLYGLRFFDSGRWYWVPLIAVAFLLSMLSKQTTIVFIVIVPLAIIAFRGTGWGRLGIILLALGLVAIPVINISGIAIKVAIVLASVVFVLFVYLLKNEFLNKHSLQTVWGSLKLYLQSSFKLAAGGTEVKEADKFWGFSLAEFLKPGYYIAFVIPVVLLIVLDVYGTYAWNMYLVYTSIIVLWVLLFVAKPHVKFIALIGLFIVLLNAAILNGIQEKFTYYIFTVLSVLLFFYAAKPFKWLSVVLLVICTTLLVVRIHDHWFPLLIIVFALFGREGKLKVFTYIGFSIVGVSFVWFAYSAFFLKRIDYSYYTHFLPMMTAIMYFRYRKASFNMVLASMAFFLAVSNVSSWVGKEVAWPGTPANIVQMKVKAVIASRADVVNINPENINRPLRYIEIPVNLSDALSIRLGTASDVLLRYLKLVFIPYPMAYYYGYSCIQGVSIFSPVPLISVFIHALLLLAGFWLIRKQPLVGFGILLYLVSISIYTNLIMPVPGMLANRFLLIPSLGFSFVLVAIIFKLSKVAANVTWNGKPWQVLPANSRYAVSAILVLASLMTIARNSDWKDYLTLFRADIKHIENSAQAQNLLGLHLFLASGQEQNPAIQNQLREEAIPHFKKALEIYPGFLNAAFDLARMLDAMHRSDEAYTYYNIATQMDSNFASPYFAMGIIQQNKGNYELAIANYERFMVKFPFNAEGFANLSFTYYQAKQFDKSIATNRRAMKMLPNPYNPTVNIGKTYYQMGQKDSALLYFKLAQRLNPDDPNVNHLVEELEHK